MMVKKLPLVSDTTWIAGGEITDEEEAVDTTKLTE